MTYYPLTITDDKGNSASINTKIKAMFLEKDRQGTCGMYVAVIDIYVGNATRPITLIYNDRERARVTFNKLNRHIEVDNEEKGQTL